jgi:hypothetical protein
MPAIVGYITVDIRSAFLRCTHCGSHSGIPVFAETVRDIFYDCAGCGTTVGNLNSARIVSRMFRPGHPPYRDYEHVMVTDEEWTMIVEADRARR